MRFTADAPEESLFNDFKLMNGLSEEQLEEFLSVILTFLAGQTSSEFMQGVSDFAQKHGININALKSPLRGALIISFSLSHTTCCLLFPQPQKKAPFLDNDTFSKVPLK